MMNGLNRRGFFSKAALGLLSVVVAPKMMAEECSAGDAPKGKKVVKEGDATAKRIEYYAKASDGKDSPKYKEGDNCANCRFYNKKKAEGGWAPCMMAANQYVASCGWCKLYRAQA